MANFQEICSTDPSKTQNNDSGNVKNVTVLLSSDVTFGEKTGEVLMPNLFEMARIKKPGNGQFKTGIRFSSKMSEKDVEKTLQDEFNILRNHRLFFKHFVFIYVLCCVLCREIWNFFLVNRALSSM